MEAKVAVVVPVGQECDAVLVLAALAADVVVWLRLARCPSVGPTTTWISANLDALRGPDPAVDPRGLELGIFTAAEIANPAAGPDSINVG